MDNLERSGIGWGGGRPGIGRDAGRGGERKVGAGRARQSAVCMWSALLVGA